MISIGKDDDDDDGMMVMMMMVEAHYLVFLRTFSGVRQFKMGQKSRF